EVRADAPGRRGRGDRVDATVQLEIAPDVADGVDGGRAVLAAEEHDLRRPRHTAAGYLAEDLVRHLVRAVQRERVRRVQVEHGRLIAPGERQVEEARRLERRQQRLR